VRDGAEDGLQFAATKIFAVIKPTSSAYIFEIPTMAYLCRKTLPLNKSDNGGTPRLRISKRQRDMTCNRPKWQLMQNVEAMASVIYMNMLLDRADFDSSSAFAIR